MFFPSRKYLIDLIKSNQEILERIVSDERLFLNSAKKEEYLRKKESLIREIDQAKQDLRLRDEAVDAGKVKEPQFGKPSFHFPFNEWSTERLAKGQKIATSRTSQFGNVGDTFTAGGRTFEITAVSRKSLADVAQNYYFDEGATSPEEFKQVWESIHPGGVKPGQIVYFHQFRELTPEVVQLKDLLAKSQLTQEESQKAVSLTQKIFKTESRNVLTPEENLALNKQVRQNLADSYAQLLKETQERAANAAAYRKRQLEDEYNTLLQIKKRAPVPDVPEIPPLSPVTDKGFMKNVENFPFITYEPRPPINYVIKPKEADISDFAPQWFGKQDTPDTLPPIVPPTSAELITDWFQFRHYILREAMEERKGIVSLPRYQGTDKIVGVPKVKSPLFVERSPQEIAAVKKAERQAEEARIIKEVKEKGLFINKGKPGGRLTDNDFYEPHIGDDGKIYYRPVFFRTKEGTIQYAGENSNIMLESQLSQDLNPRTTIEDRSFISSERLGKMMKERGEAYRFEQYDEDAILSNKGLPVKKLDDLKRDEERFKKEFITHFFIKHPEQLQVWLDKADPDTLRYLNEVWGGIDVVKRQYLPQIEYVARNEKGERVRKSLVVAKTNYDLPEDLVIDRALKEQLVQKGLIDSAENRMFSILSQKTSAGEFLTREFDENIPLDVGVSARKIVQAVQAETANARKNTVVYLIEEEVPTEPEQYSQLIKDLQGGKRQYLSKIGEEIKGEEVKLPEPGLGMSVSSDVLDLLKPRDVHKGIRVSEIKPVENDIQVVRFIPPFKKMAPFNTIKDIRAQALKEIESDDAALKGADPLAIKGTVIYAVKEPWGNIRQKGTLVTEAGELYDFVEYKGPNPGNPVLEYHKRYTIPKPELRFPEGAQRLTIPLNENKAVYSPYENYQVSTKGRVTEAHFGEEGSKTFQWGYIEDEEGSRIKWTTFKEDRPPELKAGQDYTIYNAWMQAYQEKPRWDPVKRLYIASPTTGKPEININIKPQNIYSRDSLAKEEDAERIKELRESTYRTIAEIGKPKLFEQSAGLQPKPKQTLSSVDPVIATAVESGEIIVITKSGKRIPSEEYWKQFKPVTPGKDVGAAYDEETLNKIEEENPFDDETLFMIGLLPAGALGIPELSPEKKKEEIETAKRASVERIATEPGESFWDMTSKSVTGFFDAFKYDPEASARRRKELEEHPTFETEFAQSLNPFLVPGSIMSGKPQPLPGDVLAKYYPEQMKPLQEVADVMEQGFSMPGVGGPMAMKGEFTLIGPELMAYIKSARAKGLGSLWQDIQKAVPEFLRNEEAVLGRKVPSEAVPQPEPVPSYGFRNGLDMLKESGQETNAWDQWTRWFEPQDIRRHPAAYPPRITGFDKAAAEAYERTPEVQAKLSRGEIIAPETLYDIASKGMLNVIDQKVVEETLKTFPDFKIPRITTKEEAVQFRIEQARADGEKLTPEMEAYIRQSEEWNPVWEPKAPRQQKVFPIAEPQKVQIEVPPMTEAEEQAWKEWQDITNRELPPPRKSVPKSDYENDPTTREQAGTPLSSPSDETQGHEGATRKSVLRKLFQLENEIAKKEAEKPPFDWKKAGAYALAGVTGITAAAIGLAGMLNAQQEEEMRRYEAEHPPLPAATETPLASVNTSIPEPVPEAGEPSAASQIGDTAMAAAGTALGIAQEARDVVMSSPLGPAVSEGWDIFMKAMDILQTTSYAEGGLIKSAQSVLANPADMSRWKFYGYQWKITPSEALGVVEKGELSWRTVPALALDIAIDPMTYLTLGSGAATKIGIVGSKQIALNPNGVRALAEVAKKVGPKQGEREFAEMLALDPRLRKEYQAFEGIGLRGWGPFFSGHEKELISKEALEAIKAAPKGYWDKSLRAMATSGNPQVEHAAEVLLKADESAGRKVDWAKDVVGSKFTPFYEIKKIPRPSSLGPRDPEYAERFMQFKHTVRFRTSQLYKRMERLRDEAKDELGSGYKEIVARYIENPVLRESAGLSPRTLKIIEELETYNKAFAEAEAERGLLENTIEGYLHHMLSPEAKKYLDEKGMTSTEVFAPLRSKLESARMRGYRGSIEEVNELSRKRLGFNLFDPDPFKATAVRGAESFHATGEYDLFEYVTKNYGRKVTGITDPSMGFARRTPQLMNILPPEVSSTLLKDAKDILKKVEPTREYTSWTGQKFTASDVLRIAAENKLVREKIADQAAREVVETEFGKKAVTIYPDQEEIARTAVLLDRLTRGVPEKEAAEYALSNLRNVELPEAILKHLEPAIADKKWYEPVVKGYDKGMNIWKYFQTVPFPAYHAGNIFGWGWNSVMLGETNPASTIEAMKVAFYKIPEGSLRKKAFKPLFETAPEDRFITTALGEKYSYDDLFEAAGEYGAFGQPGAMDITGKMEFSERTDLWGKTVKGAARIDPANLARSEENVMRLAVFIDRVKAGDTFIDASRYSSKFNFDYMPEAKTAFMNTYMARSFPFLTWQYNNILLQSEMFFRMPGKYSTFGKTADAAMGNEETPDWAKEGYLPWLTEAGKFAYIRTPITDMTFFNNPAMYGAQALAPFIKAPMEAWAAQSFFTGREFKDPVTEAALENFPGRPYSTYKMLTSPNKTPEEKARKGLLTVGTAKTQTERTLEEQFKKASRRKEDFTWEQRFEGWKRDEMASPLSGIPDELQGGHIQAVAEGGKAEMSNFLTMTFEENLEQTSSQVFRMGLPEKKFLQDRFWEEMNFKEGTKLQESTLRTTEKLEKEGKWVNDAVREKLEYDARKAINIQLYSRELAKIRMQLDWAERRLRNEQRGMERKQKDPDFDGDKWSERQIQALQWFIPKYQVQYAAIERLREQERGKEFELPEQIIQGEDYNKGMLGKEREVNIRGKGPALADPEQIKNMVRYDEIALERSVILEDVAILNLPKYIPKHIRDSIKKPTGPEWKEKQKKVVWYARAIWGDEPEVPEEPTAVEKPEEGWVVSPLMPVTSVALINMGMGRTSPVPGLNRPLKTQASPLEKPAGGESPGWNLRLPSVSDVVGLFMPRPDAAEPVSEEAVQQKADLAKEEFLESDEFITAVQSIITDYLDRGIER